MSQSSLTTFSLGRGYDMRQPAAFERAPAFCLYDEQIIAAKIGKLWQ